MWLFKSDNTKEVNKLRKLADKVVALEEIYKNKTEEELKNSTIELKDRLAKGEKVIDILPDAFATMREAASRVLNMRHYYVQILGGIALHQGRIAEMATGEGKTLMSTLPAYLNALTGKPVHIVTVNEYLAKRDAEWMGKVYNYLGMSVGITVSNMSPAQKKQAYNCDITYCTNNELGFDYLRDNMVTRIEDRVQRGHYFAIVDEVDSILIDEARTPLIISGKGFKSSETYHTAQKFATTLKADEDFEIEKKQKSIILTEQGIEKAERFFKVDNLADVSCLELNHHINNALRANFIMKRDENYIVKDDEIVIVDEFTGRLMDGRRYSEGLHQAIEAKENVKIKDENKTLATVTFQNYFRKYTKLSGMTGTAKTEDAEFKGIYKLDVIQIPPNLPKQRKDYPDIVYRTVKGKYNAIIEEVKERHANGQPILIGTTTIERSEELSKELKHAGIKHTVLNAKNHERESEIVAQAGRLNAVTIATNMAGRGTDILLGGNAEFMAKHEMREKQFTEEEISFATAFTNSTDEKLLKAREVYNELYKKYKEVTNAEKQKVLEAGGLHIIGTERHESRRIDNQLRGRAGRQGDPGSSVFYLSLEDDLLVRFGGAKLQGLAEFMKIDDNTPFQLKLLSKSIERAQKAIEAQNFAIRRTVTQFDDVMNNQRELIYSERNKVLEGVDVHNQIMDMFPDIVADICRTYVDEDKPYFEWNLDELNKGLEVRLLPKGTNLVTEEFVDDCELPDLVNNILKVIDEKYEANVNKLKEIGVDFSGFERHILLKVVDTLWMDHIDQMTILKNEMGLRAYGQQDPVVAYKQEGFELFDKMIDSIQLNTSAMLLNVKIDINRQTPAQDANKRPEEVRKQTTVKNETVEPKRNEPCPCGSGKKYKNCCGK